MAQMVGLAFAILRSVPVFMRSLFHDFDPTALGLLYNRTQLKALIILNRMRRPTMTMLSTSLDLQKGSTTGLVDGLENQGLVRRCRDQEDRRSIVLELTEQGTRIAEKSETMVQRHINGKLDILTDTEKTKLIDCVEFLNNIARKLSECVR
ncbi:MAG: MarR family transcriptional regulator [Chitinivibrionales bacterium]|nr:MarR family transcriptional regulator [Chitinivibrionales bacterium]MBD3358354.1 MarR family transcriptional regulator [Chitinivibrionales bacterium]